MSKSRRNRNKRYQKIQNRLPSSNEVGTLALWERQQAVRTLLQNPLIHTHGIFADEFRMIKRHKKHLKEWFHQNLGWHLMVEGELARLHKIPANLNDSTRPALSGNVQTAFNRRRYVFLCLALAGLERSERQITLGELFQSIHELWAAEPRLEKAGIQMDTKERNQRKDLVAVVQYLMDHHVLLHVEGDQQQFVEDRGEVLYTVYRPAMVQMLSARIAPSLVESEATIGTPERIQKIVQENYPDTDDGRRLKIRHKLMRRLIDDPVLYFSELTEEESAYLKNQYKKLTEVVEEATGMRPEIRKEGFAMLDDSFEMTDKRMPDEGTSGHIVLLLAEFLAKHLQTSADLPIGKERIYQYVADLVKEHHKHWRKDVLEPNAEKRLAEEALGHLEALALVEMNTSEVFPFPTIGRYRYHLVEGES